MEANSGVRKKKKVKKQKASDLDDTNGGNLHSGKDTKCVYSLRTFYYIFFRGCCSYLCNPSIVHVFLLWLFLSAFVWFCLHNQVEKFDSFNMIRLSNCFYSKNFFLDWKWFHIFIEGLIIDLDTQRKVKLYGNRSLPWIIQWQSVVMDFFKLILPLVWFSWFWPYQSTALLFYLMVSNRVIRTFAKSKSSL